MEKSKHINIIGGGMAGMSLALSLQQEGIEYRLFERNAEISYENVGLGISRNIFTILEDWGLLAETMSIGAEIQKLCFVDKHLNYLKSLRIKSPALSVNRKLFYQLILKNLDNRRIHINSPRTSADFATNEIVISADGLESDTRKGMYPALKLRDAKQILWRGISEIVLQDRFKNAYHDFIGNNLRFAIIHTGGNYYSWYIIKEKTTQGSLSPDKDKEELKSFFKGYHPVVQQVIESSGEIYSSALMDIKPSARKNLKWFKHHNLMIGDAIHPTTPNMANGACLAIEDAYLLSDLLSKLLSQKSTNIEEVYTTFQKRREKKVNPIVEQSWLFGNLMHSNNSLMDFAVKTGVKIMPQFMFDRIYSKVLIGTKKEL